MLKQVKMVATFVFLTAICGSLMGAEAKAPKIKPQLEQLSLEGVIVKKIKETKTGRKNTYYYLKTSDSEKVRLSNQVKGKKGYTDAAKVDLKGYVDKKVCIKVRATKTKAGKPSVKVITKLSVI